MITGSIVALVTPMNMEDGIDWEALDALLEWHIDEGTSAIVPVGTTGESPTVSMEENCKIIEHVVKAVNNRVPVIAGTGANATWEAIELTQVAKDAGADACLLVTPYYNKPTQEGLYQHYKAIAEAVDLPQVLYNVPGRTACDMLPETVARLYDIDQVVAVKEATGDIERTKQILELCDVTVYSGDDATARELMINGAKGTISVTANIAPAKMAAMCNAAVAGNAEDAATIDKSLEGLHKNLFLEANPIPAKWALAEMGRIPKGIRLPLTELSPEHHDALRDAMRMAGVTN
ncbi:MAG TPA: 4-hydroxy-tetrahydrodipicolinate synthase [Gammaproteobacteria bacterium]|nr:4-hydroxy-tetrahydrodipicolinate synthase [Gammaproteobacteria bacterium]